MSGGAHAPRLIGVVPAAGYAIRLQPLRGSKEVIRVAGKPVMDHLIDRLRLAGCTDIRVVTRAEKTDVIDHAEELGLTVVRARPASVSGSLLAGIRRTESNDVVLFGFPDTIWEPLDGFARLLEALDGFEVALGLFRSAEARRSDVVRFAESGLVTSIRVKPPHPGSDWVWGCAVARRAALDALSADPEPGAVFDAMCPRHEVVGVPLSGPFFDIGTREALRSVGGGAMTEADQGRRLERATSPWTPPSQARRATEDPDRPCPPL